MVAGNKRSRTFRKVYVKTPSGVRIHYRRRKPSAHRCPVYGTVLPGTARGNAADIRKKSRSERKPSRPFGGCLSSRAMREEIKKRFLA